MCMCVCVCVWNEILMDFANIGRLKEKGSVCVGVCVGQWVHVVGSACVGGCMSRSVCVCGKRGVGKSESW